MTTRRKKEITTRVTRRPQVNDLASRPAYLSTDLKTIQSAANAYCLLHYAVAFSSGVPRRLCLHGKDVWIVPVVLTSPGIGAVGDVGVLTIDAATHEVIAATPRAEVRAAGARLAQEKRDEIDAAFRRARTVG
jgi:hypothetical protein